MWSEYAIGISFQLIGSFFSNLGINVQKYAHSLHQNLPSSDPQASKPYFTLPTWIIGFICFCFGEICSGIAMGYCSQSLLAVLSSYALILNGIFGLIFHTDIDQYEYEAVSTTSSYSPSILYQQSNDNPDEIDAPNPSKYFTADQVSDQSPHRNSPQSSPLRIALHTDPYQAISNVSPSSSLLASSELNTQPSHPNRPKPSLFTIFQRYSQSALRFCHILKQYIHTLKFALIQKRRYFLSSIIIMAGSAIVIVSTSPTPQSYSLNDLLNLGSSPIFLCFFFMLLLSLCITLSLYRSMSHNPILLTTISSLLACFSVLDAKCFMQLLKTAVFGPNPSSHEIIASAASSSSSSLLSSSPTITPIGSVTIQVTTSMLAWLHHMLPSLFPMTSSPSSQLPVPQYLNPFTTSVYPYILFLVFVTCATLNLHFLNLALQIAPTSQVYPLYFTMSTTLVICSGMLFFQEYTVLSWSQLSCFGLGVCVCLAGIITLYEQPISSSEILQEEYDYLQTDGVSFQQLPQDQNRHHGEQPPNNKLVTLNYLHYDDRGQIIDISSSPTGSIAQSCTVQHRTKRRCCGKVFNDLDESTEDIAMHAPHHNDEKTSLLMHTRGHNNVTIFESGGADTNPSTSTGEMDMSSPQLYPTILSTPSITMIQEQEQEKQRARYFAEDPINNRYL